VERREGEEKKEEEERLLPTLPHSHTAEVAVRHLLSFARILQWESKFDFCSSPYHSWTSPRLKRNNANHTKHLDAIFPPLSVDVIEAESGIDVPLSL